MDHKIDCLACDKKLVIPEWLNTDDYDGGLKCKKCKAYLEIKFNNGKLLKYRIVKQNDSIDYKKMLKEKVETADANIRKVIKKYGG